MPSPSIEGVCKVYRYRVLKISRVVHILLFSMSFVVCMYIYIYIKYKYIYIYIYICVCKYI